MFLVFLVFLVFLLVFLVFLVFDLSVALLGCIAKLALAAVPVCVADARSLAGVLAS